MADVEIVVATPEEPIRALAGAASIAIVRHASGFTAIEDACPHAGCAFSLDGEVDGDTLICNCHGSEFTLPGGAVAKGPAGEGLATYEVTLRGDVLVVDPDSRRDPA